VLVAVGCTNSSSPGLTAENSGALKVTVHFAGGPPTRGGGTPNFPVPHAEVTVTANDTSLSATANNAGVATFRLLGGRYSIHVSTCGTGKLEATVTPARSTSLTWICSIS
jgi:hypothetical protein